MRLNKENRATLTCEFVYVAGKELGNLGRPVVLCVGAWSQVFGPEISYLLSCHLVNSVIHVLCEVDGLP